MSLHKQLQDQIASLESKNRKLRESLIEKESELKFISKQDSMQSKTLGAVLEEIDNLENCLSEDVGLGRTESSKKRIYDSIKEIKIRFTPTESYNSLYIMGDFNKWEPAPLKKAKDSFVYTATLLKNYKYYYIFSSSSDPFIIDFNTPHELNFASNQLNNYIILGENADPFDYKNEFHLLEEAYRNYKDLNIDPTDLKLLQSLKKVTDSSHEYCSNIVRCKEKSTKIIQQVFEEKEVTCQSLKKIERISKLFANRVFKIKNSLHILIGINIEAGYLSCMRLYDDNNISIDYQFYRNNGLYIKYPLKQFLANSEGSAAISHIVLSEAISRETMNKFSKSPSKLIVYYKLITVIKNNPLAVMKIGFVQVRKQYDLEIVKVENENGIELPLAEYNFDISESVITSIKSKAENMRILCILKEIKETKAEPILEFMTSVIDKKLKIIHCKSMSEYSGIDNNTLCIVDDDLNTSPIEKINHLRVTIKNNKVSKVVLVSESLEESNIPFTETKFSLNQLVLVKGSVKSYLVNSIAKIYKISEKISGHFSSNSFTLSELRRNVGVQVDIMFDCKLKYCNFMLGLPTINNLVALGMKDEERFNHMLDHQFQLEEYNEIALLSKLHSMCIELSETNNKQKMKEAAKENAHFLPKIQEYLQANECWNKLEDIAHIYSFFENS